MDATIRDALRRSLGTRARRWLLVGTPAVGLLAAVALVPAAGEMSALRWVQWLGVPLVWGVGLNAVGTALPHRRDRPTGR
ncbi:hypothetical protein AB0869_03370 [Micromonospora vinacea]|uniref:hypothetical protein n=1 Tax=Micromonospora vinacea TaxID=709878 RepID=UPI0034516D45